MRDTVGLALGTALVVLLLKTAEMVYHSICLIGFDAQKDPDLGGVMTRWPVSERLPS